VRPRTIGRELTALGHTVRLMPPGYVKAYVKRSKNDAADTAAICEAVTRPSMRFVPVKTVDQQAALMLRLKNVPLGGRWPLIRSARSGKMARLAARACRGWGFPKRLRLQTSNAQPSNKEIDWHPIAMLEGTPAS
jgi:hypothetical protein